jgi:hypothetical protein
MKNQVLKSALMAVAGIGLLAGSAMATYRPPTDPCPNGDTCTWSDSVDYTNNGVSDGAWFNDISDFKVETFSIAPPFEPGIDTLRGVTFWFEIQDDNGLFDRDEKVKLTVAEWNYTTKDIDDEDGYDWSNSYASGTLFTDLSADGSLTVKIAWADGDYWLQGAGIDAEVCDNTAPVPEPAAMLLFGTGILGLAATGRRKINK